MVNNIKAIPVCHSMRLYIENSKFIAGTEKFTLLNIFITFKANSEFFSIAKKMKRKSNKNPT